MGISLNTAPTTPTSMAEGEIKDINNKNKVGGNQLRSINRGVSGHVQKSTYSLFEGVNKYIGVVLGLRTEHQTKKFPFGLFQEKLVNYVVTTFTNGG